MTGGCYACNNILVLCDGELEFELCGNEELVDTGDAVNAGKGELLFHNLLMATKGGVEDERSLAFTKYSTAIE